MSRQIVTPFEQFFDSDGTPLDNGSVYIGTANLNPETNPVQVYWDDARTIPAAQPIKTSNGHMVRNGTPARVFANVEDYSMTVKDKKGRIVWTVMDVTSISTISGPNGSQLVGFIQSGAGAVQRTAQDKLRQNVDAADFGALGNGSGDLVGSAAVGASWNAWPSWINGSNYGTKPGHDYGDAAWLAANKPFLPTDTWDFVGIQLALWAVQTAGGGVVNLTGTDYVVSRPVRFVMPATGIGVDLVGSHHQKCQIRPLVSLPPINSLGANIGSGVLYFYRIGLSGCSIKNLGVTTYPKNGGTPTIEFSSATVTANWMSNGTYRACVLMTNCDTLDFENVFMSGYGEAGIAAIDISAFSAWGLITEYQSCGVLAISNSTAFITESVIFSSSGTGITAWGTSGICLSGSRAYVSGGQIGLMRNWAVHSTGAGNSFTLDDVLIYTENKGLLFNCKGLVRWRVANCFMTYGVPDTTPIVLLDHQNAGGDSLNPNSTGLFTGNNVSNVGGLSTLDIMRVNGTHVQITNNNFNAQANGSLTGNTVINSLINGNYFGPGTVKCIFSENILQFFDMSKVSVFGTKQNNIDTIGNSILVGTAYPGAITVNAGTTSNFSVTVTGAALGDIVFGVSFILNQLTGLTVSANVTAANTVVIQLSNLTAGNISISNELWTVLVQRKNCL